MTHNIKLDIQYCADVTVGAKLFEIRFNDRDYKLNDLIQFQAVSNREPIDCAINNKRFVISYVLREVPGLQDGYVILGLKEALK